MEADRGAGPGPVHGHDGADPARGESRGHPSADRAGRATSAEHYPPEKIAFYQRTPVWCRRTALDVGPACSEVVAALLADNALFRLRAAQGVLGLRSQYTPARLEAACATAMAAGDPSYRTIKGLLAAGLEDLVAAEGTAAQRAAQAAAVPAFLRGQDSLFDLTDSIVLPDDDAVAPETAAGAPDGLIVPDLAVLHLPTTPATGTTSPTVGTTSPTGGTTSPTGGTTSTATGTAGAAMPPAQRMHPDAGIHTAQTTGAGR